MGSTGKAPSGGGGTSLNTQEEQPVRTSAAVGEESDVASHKTPMSQRDLVQIGYSPRRYFQSVNSMKINNALREAAEQGRTFDDVLADYKERDSGSYWTILAMERNMHPTNADMQLVRMAGDSYIEKLFSSVGLSEDIAGMVSDLRFATGTGRTLSADTLNEIRSKVVGATVTEAAYSSCTWNTSLSDSEFSDRHVKLEIEAPKGTRGLFSPTSEESEWVNARNTSYVIQDVSLKDNKLVFKCKIQVK